MGPLVRIWHARGQGCMAPGGFHFISGCVVPDACLRPRQEATGCQRTCRSAGQRVGERPRPLKAVAPVRIRSGLPSSTSTSRPLTWTDKGQGPSCVSDQVRPGPAVGEYLCPIRARVRPRRSRSVWQERQRSRCCCEASLVAVAVTSVDSSADAWNSCRTKGQGA
jgi:hypothetical protein